MTSPLHILRRFALTHRIFRLVKTKTLATYLRRAMKGRLPEKDAELIPEGRAIRVALIGVGRHAREVLLPAIQHVPGLELAGLCVRTSASQAELGAKWSVPVVLHYEEVLTRDDVDAVIVATPSALHRYLVMDAARCGKHVFCEAAGIVSEIDIAQVTEAKAGREAVVQYGHRFWYAPIYRALADAAQTFGKAGERSLRFVYPEALHLYGIALMIDGPIEWVEAHGKEHDCTYDVQFENGDKGFFEPLPDEPDSDRMAELVEITCGEEKLVAEGGTLLKRVAASGKETELGRFEFDAGYAQDHSRLPDGSDAARGALQQRGYIAELESFVQCMRTGAEPLVGVDQAGAVFRLVWAMFESVGVGKRIEIPQG